MPFVAFVPYTHRMPARLLTGKEPAEQLLEEIKPRVQELDPKLTIVQVGDDPASSAYIRNKMKGCEKVEMRCELIKLAVSTTFDELLRVIDGLNNDNDVSGFIVQFPLPGDLQDLKPQILKAMDPAKDVDGLTAYNMGKLIQGVEYEHLPPATPAGILRLLQFYTIDIKGRTAVVVGQGDIVGKPLSIMLDNRSVTVIRCDISTKPEQLQRHCREDGDLLFTAVGKQNLVTGDMVKPGAVVIDIGISKTKEGKLVGDVEFEKAKDIAAAITPVPGGVGPMTVAHLLKNVVTAKERQMEKMRAQ